MECRERLVTVGKVMRELLTDTVRVERYSERGIWNVSLYDTDGGYWDMAVCRYHTPVRIPQEKFDGI